MRGNSNSNSGSGGDRGIDSDLVPLVIKKRPMSRIVPSRPTLVSLVCSVEEFEP